MRDAVCQCGTQLDVLKTDSGCVTPAVDQRPRGLDARQQPAKASSSDRFVGDEGSQLPGSCLVGAVVGDVKYFDVAAMCCKPGSPSRTNMA